MNTLVWVKGGDMPFRLAHGKMKDLLHCPSNMWQGQDAWGNHIAIRMEHVTCIVEETAEGVALMEAEEAAEKWKPS